MTFALKELDGPFNIISRFRNLLFRTKYIKTFFYKLFECYYCLGMWSSAIVYLIATPFILFSYRNLVIYCFAGAITCIILSALLTKLYEESV